MNLEFRIWNDVQKFWINPDRIGISANGNILILDTQGDSNMMEWDFDCWNGNRIYKIKQYAGALDKKNQKIFEGDIVLFDNPDPYDGQDQLTKIVGYNSRVMGFRLYNFTHEVDKYGGTVFFPEQVEVIGNIFEGAIKDGINYGEYLKEK